MTIHDWVGLRMGYKWVQVGAVWILMDAVGSEARGGAGKTRQKEAQMVVQDMLATLWPGKFPKKICADKHRGDTNGCSSSSRKIAAVGQDGLWGKAVCGARRFVGQDDLWGKTATIPVPVVSAIKNSISSSNISNNTAAVVATAEIRAATAAAAVVTAEISSSNRSRRRK